MSAILARESETVPSYLPEPLTAPSVDAAMEFLQLVVPPTVFSRGSGVRRGQPDKPLSIGRKSDQAFLVFYRRGDLEGSPQLKPLKSPTSIRQYLTEQANGHAAEHWCSLQLTQYRVRRDGKQLAAYTTETGRHILGIVLDLDGKRMAAYHQGQLKNGWVAFRTAVEARLEQLMIEEYYLVRSGPEGAHLYIPLVRPDGLPLRTSEKNVARWERAARGVNRLFADLGADQNAVRLTQPFVIPGMPRLKWPEFIPHLIARRAGVRTNLFALLRRLSELKLMPRWEKVCAQTLPTDAVRDIDTIIEDITTRAIGVPSGCRNDVAHKVAVYLLCKGATSRAAWDAMVAWNKRNAPPLSGRELSRCLRSAERCADRSPQKWLEMQEAVWRGLRGTLELTGGSAGFIKNGRWHPITPAKPWEQRKAEGGREHYEEVAERLLRLVAGEGGGYLQLTQEEIANIIDTNRSTLRVVLDLLKASGRLGVTTKKGRGGKTSLTLPMAEPDLPSVKATENGHSGNSSEAAEMGVWVGDAGVSPGLLLIFFLVSSCSGWPLVRATCFWRDLRRKLSFNLSAGSMSNAVNWVWLSLLYTGMQEYRKEGEAMARVLAVASQKGGVGKSTAAVSLSGVALEEGRLKNPATKVLLIDTDPQGNASGDLGVWPEGIKGGCADLFDTDKPLDLCIQETKVAGLWLAAGDLTMYQIAEDIVESQPKAERLNILRGKIERFLAADQDWIIIIDTPPDLGLYTKNALIAAERVIAPVNEDIRSVYGLQLLLKTVEGFRMRINRRLSLIGIFRSSWRGDSNYAKSVHRYLDRQYRELQFETEVRQDIRIREAHTDSVPVNFYDPKSRAAEAYRDLWGEIQDRW